MRSALTPSGTLKGQPWLACLGLILFFAYPATNRAAPKPATAGNAYVGNKACRGCHHKEVESYSGWAHDVTSRTPSLSSVEGNFEGRFATLHTSNPYLYFLMTADQGSYFQTAVVGLPGAEPITRTERLDIVVGSGRKGHTYLSWKNDKLFELPVSYLTELGGWTNSPGYPDGLPNFDEPIVPRCLECHATYFESQPPPNNRYSRGNFVLGITCERCHGPGEAHVLLNQSKSRTPTEQAASILNPASLSRDRQVDQCALCHAGPATPTAPAFSFAAGEAIGKYLEIPSETPGGNSDVHGHQLQLLQSSKCFKSSSMTCSTCHNIHLPATRCSFVLPALS